MDLDVQARERRRRRDELQQHNRPSAVGERLAQLKEQREIAEYHRLQDEKAWQCLSDHS
jgi:hypothetical protein